jgi:hypothetical protein
VYELYFEDGYIESAYLTRIAEMAATLPVVASVSAIGEKTILDGYYFEEGYITTGYYVYIAQGEVSLSSAFAVNCNTTFQEFFATLSSSFSQTATGGKLVGFTITLSSSFTQTVNGNRNADIDLFAFGNAALAVEVSRIRDNNIAVSSAFTIAVDVTRTRNLSSEDAAVFTAIINGLRSRDVNIETQAAFSLTANVQRTTDIVLTAFTNGTLTALGVVERSTGSSLSTQANITVDVARSRSVTSTLTTTASLSTPGERTRVLQADLASAYTLTAQGQRTTDIVLTAFTNGTLSAIAIVNRTLASSQSTTATISVVGGLSVVATATMTSRATVRGYLDVLIRNLPPTANTGGIYNTAVIDNSVYKFGGGSLTWDEVTRAFTDSQPVLSGSTFYFFQTGYTWSSSNNGSSWTRVSNNLTEDPDKTDTVVTLENGYFLFYNQSTTYLHYSTDGVSWSKFIPFNPNINGFRIASSKVYYYNGSYYLFGKFLSGASISRVGWASNTALTSGWGLSYNNSGEIASDSYKSNNGVVIGYKGGTTNYLERRLITNPVNVTVGLTNANLRQVAYDSGNQDYAVIYDYDGSTKYLAYSTNNGSTWLTVGASLPLTTIYDLQYVNGSWLISTALGLYKTDFSTITKLHDYRVGTVLYNGSIYLSTLLDRPGFFVYTTNTGFENNLWYTNQVNDITGVGGSLTYATGQLGSTGTIDFWVNIVNEDNQVDLNRYGRDILRVRQDANNYLTITVYTVYENTYISVSKYLDGGQGQLFRANFNLSGWSHIRFVQDGTSAALYINGERVTNTGYVGYSTSWPNGAITGPTEVLQRDPVWIDELLITTDVLTTPSTSSFTVPTNRWDNTANTKLLLHFNNDFADDSRFQVIPEARLTSVATLSVTTNADYVESFALSVTATLSVQGQRTTDIVLTAFTNGSLTANNTRTRDNDSSQSSAFSQTASAVRSRDNGSLLNASASVTANNTRTRSFDSSLSAFATTVTVAQETSEISANLQSAFNTVQRYIEDGTFAEGYFTTSQTIANYTASGRAVLASAFTVNADSDYLTNFSASLSSNAALSATSSRTRVGSSSMASAATVTAAATKTTVTSVALSSSATLTVIGIKGSEIALYAFTNASLTANNTRTRATSSTLSSPATLYVDTANSLSKLAESYLSSAFTQTAVNTRTRSTSVTLQAFAAEVTVNRRQRTASANLSSAFTLTVNGSRGIILASSMAVTATVTATGNKTVVGTVSMSAAMTATMIVREIRTDTIVYRIPAEDWVYNITAENRKYAINGETRVFKINSESRVRNIAQETRILTIK